MRSDVNLGWEMIYLEKKDIKSTQDMLDVAEMYLDEILDWAQRHGQSYVEDLVKGYYEQTRND